MLPLEIVETDAALTWSFYTIPAIILDKSAPIINVLSWLLLHRHCSAHLHLLQLLVVPKPAAFVKIDVQEADQQRH